MYTGDNLISIADTVYMIPRSVIVSHDKRKSAYFLTLQIYHLGYKDHH